jgi:hypothetical protein
MIILRWRDPVPPLVLRWRLDDPRQAYAAALRGPDALAAVLAPQGPPGLDGSGGTISGTAAAALGGHRALYLAADGLRYSSADDPLTQDVLGISTGAAAQGAQVTMLAAGPLSDPSFAFVPGLIFLGLNGVLTQTPPTSGIAVELGVSINPTAMLVRVRQPLTLAN